MGLFDASRLGGGSSANPVTVTLESSDGSVLRYEFTASGSDVSIQFKDESGNIGSAISVAAGATANGPASDISGTGKIEMEVTFDATGFRSSEYLECEVETVTTREVDRAPWAQSLPGADGDLIASDGAGGVKTVGSDTYLTTDDALLGYSPRTCLYLDGTSGNYTSTPDAGSLDITGDIDLRFRGELDWAPAAIRQFANKSDVGSQRSWGWQLQTSGLLLLRWSSDGAGTGEIGVQSTVAVPDDGALRWVRVTLDVDNGASGYDVKFYTSDDGTTWSQLGATVTGGSTTNVFAGTAPVEVGRRGNNTQYMVGAVHRFEMYDGIGGTLVAAFDPSAPVHPRFRDSAGRVWSYTGSAFSWQQAA